MPPCVYVEWAKIHVCEISAVHRPLHMVCQKNKDITIQIYITSRGAISPGLSSTNK